MTGGRTGTPSSAPAAARDGASATTTGAGDTWARASAISTGARKDLRRRFGQAAPQQPVCRPGALFYVTARSGRRTAWLAGPYVSHLAALDAATERRSRLNPHSDAHWWSLGTASLPAGDVPDGLMFDRRAVTRR